MVLFKRKPVQLVPQPDAIAKDENVWVIPETNETFTDEAQYAQRMDFYKQKQFMCEITGHSTLTFFEALEDERRYAQEINETFPEPLKEPVLRRVQFSTTSRIDHLVDQVFDEFKSDFYPGERVTVLLEDGSRIGGMVREKARFPEVVAPDGTLARRASSKYLVKLMDRENEEALLADEHLARDRRVFHKAMLRGFIKNTVSREHWNGAPWLVKDDVAKEYRIDTQVPKHLQKKYASKRAAGVASASASASPVPVAAVTTATQAVNGENPSVISNLLAMEAKGAVQPVTADVPSSIPADTTTTAGKASHKRKSRPSAGTSRAKDRAATSQSQQKGVLDEVAITTPAKAMTPSTATGSAAKQSPLRPFLVKDQVQIHSNGHVNASGAAQQQSQQQTPTNPLHAAVLAGLANTPPSFSQTTQSQPQSQPQTQPGSQPPQPPPEEPQAPAIKYPIEDLEIPPTPEAPPRPPLHFLLRNGTTSGKGGKVTKTETELEDEETGKMDAATVGAILETWDTLNVYADLLKLDTFTLDDFLNALSYQEPPSGGCSVSDDVEVKRCDLLVEIHCAILKMLVGPPEEQQEKESPANGEQKEDNDEDSDEEEDEEEIGTLMIDLPPLPDEETTDSESSDTDDDDNESTDPEPMRRITRSRTSLARAEAEAAENARREAEARLAAIPHCAPAFFSHSPHPSLEWIAKLARREFRDGGWELILLGFLDRMTYSTRPRVAETATRVLTKFAPSNLGDRGRDLGLMPEERAATRYRLALGIGERVAVLEMLTHAMLETGEVRRWLDEGAAKMTELRKEKIEVQKRRKAGLEAVRRLCEERKALRREEGEKGRKKDQKEEKREEKKEEEAEKKGNGVVKKDGDGDEKMSDIDEEVAEDGESSLMLDTDVDDDRPPASDANGSTTKTADKKRRKGKDDKEKQGKPSKTKPPSQQQQQQENTSKPTTPTTTGPKSKAKERAKARELEREKEKRNKASAAILQKISEEKSRIKSLERRIADLDDKLRENDTARIRCLGTDRFWNRYYWFERNGLPYAGRAGSSTAAQGYANGRLWVLGPDESEVRGFLDDPELAKEAGARWGMTLLQRREKEEGGGEGEGGVLGPGQWGCYTEPKEVEGLLGWLDSRGVREVKLRKEIAAFKDPMLKSMRARMETLGLEEEKDEGDTEMKEETGSDGKRDESADAEEEKKSPTPPPRKSTRMQSSQDEERELLARYRCLRWKNTVALEQLGHIHLDTDKELEEQRKKHERERAQASLRSSNRKRKATTRSQTQRSSPNPDAAADDGSPAPAERRKRRR